MTKHFTVWTPCFVLFDCVWSCLIKFESHQTCDQTLKAFLLFSCLMGDFLMFDEGLRTLYVRLR